MTAPRVDVRRTVLALAAPLLAIGLAVLVTSGVLLVAGDPVGRVWRILLLLDSSEPARRRAVVNVINNATTYYFSALAVAVGFRMNLFNIGVDGQYRLGVFAAAVVGGAVALPPVLHVGLVLVVAAVVGGLWAGLAGWLRVSRGVSEVISTIMLNAIATALIAWILPKVAVDVAGSNNIGTEPIPASGLIPGFRLFRTVGTEIYGSVLLAVLAGIVVWVVLERTRFGFDLRATGRSPSAAVASGVDVPRMVLTAMLLSGAIAGLVGIPQLLARGGDNTYSLAFPAGLGFTGIAIALLGRNSPLGIAVAALLWAFLDVASNPLQIKAGVSTEIVTIMQGVIVLAVVVAYELVRRARLRAEQRRVALATSTDAPLAAEVAP